MALATKFFIRCHQANQINLSQASMSISTAALVHYSQNNECYQRIVDGFSKKSIKMDEVTVQDLEIVDEFHIGGTISAKALFSQLSIKNGNTILDIGCGIGGPSRLCASEFKDCSVVGVDITPEYVEVGNQLNSLPKVAMNDKVKLVVSDACDLSSTIDENSIDTAFMFHVGMNIKDKKKCAQEIFRVLKPGGYIGVLDVMSLEKNNDSKNDDQKEFLSKSLKFPLPFASSFDHCFLNTSSQYQHIFKDIGFELKKETCKHEFAIKALTNGLKRIPIDKVPPLSLAVVMGSNFRVKLSNCLDLLNTQTITLTELVWKKPPGV
mmetsp:Transcript_5023/g.6494  ORF Transcript_5023/g.6494 Transcript_5023/m.6494 type:complete len:322 (-) Transcript_5023:173-1138(-)